MSKRARKRHVQIEIEFRTWGGKRDGAGRKPTSKRASASHESRERFRRLTVVHVTLRVISGLGTLRRREPYFAIRKATEAVLKRSDFRIVHVSLEHDHLHLIVEAESDRALGRGVRAFAGSAAQHLNRTACGPDGGRRGKVFDDRYHARTIHSPTQARNCINYVLNNWRHHGQDEVSVDVRDWDVDYFSSAVSFGGWKELGDRRFLYTMPDEQRLCVSVPRSWLLREGWKRAGSISMFDVPGQR